MAEQSRGSADGLRRVVENLRALSGDMESCAVLSGGGELLYSAHMEGVDRERAATMLSALANLMERTARANGKEHAAQTSVRTREGHLLLVRLEDGGIVAATTAPEARVGLALYDMRNARAEIQKAIKEGE